MPISSAPLHRSISAATTTAGDRAAAAPLLLSAAQVQVKVYRRQKILRQPGHPLHVHTLRFSAATSGVPGKAGGGRRPNGFLTTVAKRCPCCAADGTPGQQAGKVRSAEGRRGRTRPSVLQPARCGALPRQGAVAARNRAARRVPGRGALGAGAHLSRDAAWKTSAGRECLALAAACTAPCFPAPFIPGLFRRMVISAAKALVLTSVPHRQSLRRARALGSASLNDFGRNASVPGAPGLGQRLPSIRGCSTDLIAKFILRARWEKLQKHQLLWRAWSLLFSLLLAHS